MRLARTAATPLMASGDSSEPPEAHMPTVARTSLSSPEPQLAALVLLCRILDSDEQWLLALAKRLEDRPAEAES
jgi:hypothetical protein